MMMWGSWDGVGWGLGMMLFSLLFLALIAVGVVFIVRSLGDGDRGAPRRGDGRAFEILDERFARGEIDQNEYQERRRILTGGR